jgi:hypothetical protein
MPNTRQPFVYTMKHKMLGTAASSTVTIPNNGVTKLTAATTYALAGPEVGSLVTIIAVGADAVISCASTVVGSTGQVAFNNAGGTQRLALNYDSTSGNELPSRFSVSRPRSGASSVRGRQCHRMLALQSPLSRALNQGWGRGETLGPFLLGDNTWPRAVKT